MYDDVWLFLMIMVGLIAFAMLLFADPDDGYYD